MDRYQVNEYRNESCIVRIHKPILTAEERRAREKEIKAALVRFEIERRSERSV